MDAIKGVPTGGSRGCQINHTVSVARGVPQGRIGGQTLAIVTARELLPQGASLAPRAVLAPAIAGLASLEALACSANVDAGLRSTLALLSHVSTSSN